MIAAEQLELMTAAVDGELSAAEYRALRRLLEESPEARALFAQLTSDSARVRALARTVAPPADLRLKVLGRIAAATPAPRTFPNLTSTPVQKPTVPLRRATPSATPAPWTGDRVRAWVPVAVAASLLLCVTAGSFAYFSTQSPTRNNTPTKQPWAHALPAPNQTPSAVPSQNPAPRQDVARPDPQGIARSPVLPVPHDPVPKPNVFPEEIAFAPEPRTVRSDLVGSRILPPLPPFEFVRVRVPFLRTVAELEREDVRRELSDDLAQEPARLDLFVRNTARGTEVFQNAAKAVGLTVFADAATLDKLKKNQIASLVIYTENLTATELAALFATVAELDAKFSPRICDLLHVAPIARTDENELKQILGIDAGLYKRALGANVGPGQGGLKADTGANPRPVSADTIASVVKSVTKSGEKTAVLLAWQTTHPNIPRTVPATSAELKQFLAKRGDRKPNAVPVVIVIRPVL